MPKDPAKEAEKITKKAAKAVEKARARDARYQEAKERQQGGKEPEKP